MKTSNVGHLGAFSFSLASRSWTWSAATFAVYGYEPDAVVPTTELLLAHQHPEDRQAVEDFLAATLGTGGPCSVWHAIDDARGTSRQVLTTGVAERDPRGSVCGLTGHVVDASQDVRRAASREVDHALQQMSRSRPLIEQAKGTLMLTYALDADGAFTILRRCSQELNVKVRELSAGLVGSATIGAELSSETRLLLDRLAREVHGEPVGADNAALRA